jgi:hypothetical protein
MPVKYIGAQYYQASNNTFVDIAAEDFVIEAVFEWPIRKKWHQLTFPFCWKYQEQ